MGKHKNQRQETILLNLMEGNEDLAKGFVKGDKACSEELWSKLVQRLNSEGPPIKDVNGWKKVLVDWKIIIRKKLAHNNKEIRCTGGGPNNFQPISATEDAIVKITGIHTVVDGIKGTIALGNSTITKDSEEAPNFPSTSKGSKENVHPCTRIDRAKEKSLSKYMEMQETNLRHMSDQLSKSVEIGKENKASLKRVYHSLDRMSDRIKEQVDEQKRHYFRLEQLLKDKNEIKKRRLEIEEIKLNNQMD